MDIMKRKGGIEYFGKPCINIESIFLPPDLALPPEITEMLPGILNQLGAESLTHLKRLASNVGAGGMGGAVEAAGTMDEEDDDEVPDLVENFDEVSKNETATATEEAKISEVEEVTEVTGERSLLTVTSVAACKPALNWT